ncbi:Ste24 endopeptidase [Ranunculus cassubicifolius]
MEFPYLESVIGFMIFMYFFETYLDLRQHSALKLPNLPKPLEGVISQEKFEKSRAYTLDKSFFHFVHEAVNILMETSILAFGVLPWVWNKSGYFLASAGINSENEIYHTLAFLACFSLWSQITDLPFSLYSTFVIEERHGFNKQTVWLFFRDIIKGLFLSALLGPPVISAIILIVQKGGPYLAIYLWAFIFVLSILMMTLYPILIAPLFNKFTPLPQGELRQKIENLVSSLKFPLKKLFVVDGSTRSSHNNCKEEEVVAVLSHELGHWKLNHTTYNFVIVQIITLLQFGGFALVRNSKELFQSFVFDTQPVLIGFVLFQHTVTPIQHLVSFGMNLVSRAFEFQVFIILTYCWFYCAAQAQLVLVGLCLAQFLRLTFWTSGFQCAPDSTVGRLFCTYFPLFEY